MQATIRKKILDDNAFGGFISPEPDVSINQEPDSPIEPHRQQKIQGACYRETHSTVQSSVTMWKNI
jgi:hypothetical protein